MNVDKKLIKKLVSVLDKFPDVERAVLFGSRARDDSRERSDYDIAIYGTLSQSEITELKYVAEEELPTLHKIDLIFMQGNHDERFIENIRKEGIVIYEKILRQV